MNRAVIILGAIIIAITMACSPKLSQPIVELPESYSYEQSEQFTSHTPLEWWQSIEDETLKALIEQALSSNLSLQSATKAISEAQYNRRVARAAHLPDLSLELYAERLREQKVYESEYEVVPTVSWQIPLFGALKSTTKVATAQVMSSKAETRGVALTLASEVATSYYSLLEYRAALDVATRSAQLRGEATALIDSMHRYGMSSGVELAQAKALTAAAEEDVANYTKSLALTQLSLATLLSTTIDVVDFNTITTSLYTLAAAKSVPVGLPSDLLYNRPDLLEAYYAVEQAMGRVGVARSAQFPSLSLTVDGGLYSSSLKGLTLSKLLTWEWAVELLQPIFNFGALRANKRALTEGYYASLLDYQQSIIAALCDVESALVSIEQTAQQSLYAKEYMDNYACVARATNALYRGGMDSYLSVVDAEREFYASQIDYLALLAEQRVNYINLYTALGVAP